MHRQVKPDEVGVGYPRVERLPREVETGDVHTGAAQPGRGRRQAEGLAAQLVGGDESDSHGVAGRNSISASVGGGVARLTITRVAMDSESAGYAVCQPKNG